LDANKLLELPLFHFLRNATATIKAAAFLLTSMAAVGVLLVYLATSYIESRTALAVIVVILFFIILSVALGCWCYIRLFCDPDQYEITEADCLLIVEPLGNHHRYTNEREQKIRARRNNVRLIESRARWTGQGSRIRFKAGSLVDKHVLLSGRRPEEDGITHQWIYLGRPLSKGDQTSIAFYQTFEDNAEPMHTFYREGGGRYRASNLRVTARFGIDEDPINVEGLIWSTSRNSRQRREVGRLEVHRKANPIARTVDYIVTVRRPRKYHSYGVRWEWPTRERR